MHRYTTLGFIVGIVVGILIGIYNTLPFNYATSVIPGGHATIFPPYFILGTIFSGLAFLQTLLILLRLIFKWENYITTERIANLNIAIAIIGSITSLYYLSELSVAWYNGYCYEQFAFYQRVFGIYWSAYFGMMVCSIVGPQLLWWRMFRYSIWWSLAIAFVVNMGMWFQKSIVVINMMSKAFSQPQ